MKSKKFECKKRRKRKKSRHANKSLEAIFWMDFDEQEEFPKSWLTFKKTICFTNTVPVFYNKIYARNIVANFVKKSFFFFFELRSSFFSICTWFFNVWSWNISSFSKIIARPYSNSLLSPRKIWCCRPSKTFNNKRMVWISIEGKSFFFVSNSYFFR